MNSAIEKILAEQLFRNLDLDELDRYGELLDKLSREAITAFARECLARLLELHHMLALYREIEESLKAEKHERH